MDLNKLNVLLQKLKIEDTLTNQYLFLMFFLERCQFIGNLINLIDHTKENALILGIKYNILYLKDFSKISKKINEFKKEFDKSELINEILSFIKSSIGIKKIDEEYSLDKKDVLDKPLISKSKIKSLISSFENLDSLVKEIDKSIIIKENDIYSYLTENNYIIISEYNSLKLERDITKMEIDWIKFKRNKKHQNKILYEVLKPWYKL